MKVFFIGSVLFSRKMLEIILQNNAIKIVGIATKSASTFNSDHSDLSDLAIQHNIPYKYVKDINAKHIADWISSFEPEVIFCLGWSSLIKKNIIDIPKVGVVGYHPAELPMNKGRHPIIWALVLGLQRTASTFLIMDEGADSGDIINQYIINISIDDNAESLYNKIINIAIMQLTEIINDLISNSLIREKQSSNIGNAWRKRGKEDGRIDWRMTSIDIYNLVRALYKPYPGAHFDYQGNEIKVWKCLIPEIENVKNLEPGKVFKIEGQSIFVKTGDGFIQLVDHELNVKEVQEYLT
jgi:methionyl-tRNA formyltransferase